MSFLGQIAEPAQWLPARGASTRIDADGLAVLSDGESDDHHLLHCFDRRFNGARIRLTIEARPAEGCDTRLCVHQWGAGEICSIDRLGTVTTAAGAEQIRVAAADDGFLAITVTYLNFQPTVTLGTGKPGTPYRGSGAAQYRFRKIVAEVLPLSPVRKQVVDRLWRGRDPFAGVPAGLYEKDLQGWNSQHRFLSEAIAALRPAVIVEIGVWKGGSTVFMANAVRSMGLSAAVIAVDTWLGSSEHWLSEHFRDLSFVSGYPALFQTFAANAIAAGVHHYIVPLPIDSLNAAAILASLQIRPDLIHLDGGHDYQAVSADLQAWWPLLRPGGMLIGDDYDDIWPSVRAAFDDHFGALGLTPIEHAEHKCQIRKPG